MTLFALEQAAVLLWCGRPERWRNLYGVSSVASVMKLLGMAHRDRPLWHQGSMVVCNLDATGGPAYFPFRENIHTQPQGEPAC